MLISEILMRSCESTKQCSRCKVWVWVKFHFSFFYRWELESVASQKKRGKIEFEKWEERNLNMCRIIFGVIGIIFCLWMGPETTIHLDFLEE